MKPRNFPGRIDTRRRVALESMPHRGVTAQRDYEATVANLQANPRDIRTKKDRSGRGRKRAP